MSYDILIYINIINISLDNYTDIPRMLKIR